MAIDYSSGKFAQVFEETYGKMRKIKPGPINYGHVIGGLMGGAVIGAVFGGWPGSALGAVVGACIGFGKALSDRYY